MKNNKDLYDELVCWAGMALILIAYALISFGVFNYDSLVYQLMNGIGAIGLVYISFIKKAYPPGVLNIIWALVAIVAIINIII